jgi:hypothetical protein
MDEDGLMQEQAKTTFDDAEDEALIQGKYPQTPILKRNPS